MKRSATPLLSGSRTKEGEASIPRHSFVMDNTPVEVQFTSAGCLNYPCPTSPNKRVYSMTWEFFTDDVVPRLPVVRFFAGFTHRSDCQPVESCQADCSFCRYPRYPRYRFLCGLAGLLAQNVALAVKKNDADRLAFHSATPENLQDEAFSALLDYFYLAGLSRS
jgi:hypothetical protein